MYHVLFPQARRPPQKAAGAPEHPSETCGEDRRGPLSYPLFTNGQMKRRFATKTIARALYRPLFILLNVDKHRFPG